MLNFKNYCKDFENIENYAKAKADNFTGWHCHHRLETHNSDGERRLVDVKSTELIALDMYWHRPASELIFLTTKEHVALHHKGKPKPKTAEHRKRMSEAHKGKLLSEETKKKMSEVKKGKPKTEEHRKKLSEAHKGRCCSKETRKKMREANRGKTRGKYWFNNGEICIRAKKCPDGFVPGMLSRK